MEISRYWRLRKELYRLEGSNCQGCGILHFPSRRVCPDCGLDAEQNKSVIEYQNIAKHGESNIQRER